MIVGSTATQPGTWCISSRTWLSGREEERALPELVVALADEGIVEEKAGDERAERQHGERDQHDERALVRRMIAVVAMLVVRMACEAARHRGVRRRARRPHGRRDLDGLNAPSARCPRRS